MVYYNPHIGGLYNPLRNLNNLDFSLLNLEVGNVSRQVGSARLPLSLVPLHTSTFNIWQNPCKPLRNSIPSDYIG